MVLAAAPGTVLVMHVGNYCPTDRDRDKFIHSFVSVGGNGQFDSRLCRALSSFIIYPNEQHTLLTDLDCVHEATVNPLNIQSPLSIQFDRPTYRLVYHINIRPRDMILNVGIDTPLSLLIRAGILHVTTAFLTQPEVIELFTLPVPDDDDDDENLLACY